MRTAVQVKGQCMTVMVPRELDHHSALPIGQQMDDILMHRNIQEIIMDFTKTEFMDSSGIGMMMGRYRQIQASGGRMRAVHAKDRVKKILHMAGISRLIEVSC